MYRLNDMEFEVLSAIKLCERFGQYAYPHRVFRQVCLRKRKCKMVMQNMRKKGLIAFNPHTTAWETVDRLNSC